MPDFSSVELQRIQREQAALREQLAALDRKIAALISEKNPSPIATPPPLPAVAQNPMELPSVSPPAKSSSWEFQLGTVWLVRIGIVILLTGFVFLGNFAYHHIFPRLGPSIKLAVLYILGGTLAGIGSRLEKTSASLKNYGRVLLAGGAALIYYTTYGATFVRQLHIIGSPLIGGLLLLGVGGVIVWLAEKRQAQSVALIAILLSYYTSAINPLGLFSLYSSLLLTSAAVYLLLRHRWTTLGWASLVGAYGSYVFWRFYRDENLSTPTQVWLGVAFLAGYWLIFTAAVFFSRVASFSAGKRTAFLTLNNAAFFALTFQILETNHPAWTGRFALFFGVILLLLAWNARRRQSEDRFLDGAYLMQGLAALTFGFLLELHGNALTLSLLIEGTLLLLCANRRHGWIFQIAAGIVTVLAFATGLDLNVAANEITNWAMVALTIINAWLSRRLSEAKWNWIALGYSLLAILALWSLLPLHAPEIPLQLASVFAFAGLGFFIRVRELSVAGQFFALAVAIPYIFEERTLSNPLVLSLAATLVFLTHWWQRQGERFSHWGQIGFFALFFIVASRWLDFSGSPFPKTLAWALLGTLALVVGFLLRDRVYRLCGLAGLALAIARVFLNDIWGLDPVFRILSFIVLGIVLLLLGFVYNKLGDKLKDWL